MQAERDRNNRSRGMPGSRAYVNPNSTEIFCIRSDGISEGKKFANDLRETCQSEI